MARFFGIDIKELFSERLRELYSQIISERRKNGGRINDELESEGVGLCSLCDYCFFDKDGENPMNGDYRGCCLCDSYNGSCRGLDYLEDSFREEYFELFKQTIHMLLETLSPTEKMVLKMRYGFGKYEREGLVTLEECGKEFKLTRERIRPIEEKAINKLRHSKRIRILENFTEFLARQRKRKDS